MHWQQLRRHGDIIKRTVGGYFIVQGRADDTMNLGGIKVPHSPMLSFFDLII
jgi:acyl-coenzyme A synthetase/AMP-(fatty) acid ligase